MYGILVTSGILAGAWVASKMARKFKIEGDRVWDGLVWIVVGGIVGARLYHVIDLWEYYRQNLTLIPQVWTGGLGIFGGIAGGVVGLWLFCQKNNQDFLKWLDLIGVGAPLGQAIGRWGNYFNQELYGLKTDLLWGIYIKAEGDYFHPLFGYESLWNLAVFGVMWKLTRRFSGKWARGTGFMIYLGLYSWGRFWLEFLRLESWSVSSRMGEIRVAQGVSLTLMVISLVLIWTRNKSKLNFRGG